MLITLQKDAEGKDHPYLIGGDEDFEASCAEKLSRAGMFILCME